MYVVGDWILCRSHGQGGTLGKLAKDFDSSGMICFSEAYHVCKFDVKDSRNGTLATLSWQAPKSAEVFGGQPAVLNEPCLAWLLDDDQAAAIIKFAEKEKK